MSEKLKFDRMKVEMFIGATADQEGNGGWCCHMVSFLLDTKYEKTVRGYGNNVTITRMALKAVIEGIRLIRVPVFLTIYTKLGQVSQGVNKHLSVWSKNGFKKADGKDLEHQDLWIELHQLLEDKDKVLSYRVDSKGKEEYAMNYLMVAHNAATYAQKAKRSLVESTVGAS